MQVIIILVTILVACLSIMQLDSISRRIQKVAETKSPALPDTHPTHSSFEEELKLKVERLTKLLDRVFPDDDNEDGEINNEIGLELYSIFQEYVNFAKHIEKDWNELINANPNVQKVLDQDSTDAILATFQESFLTYCQKLINLGLADIRNDEDYRKILSDIEELVSEMHIELRDLAKTANEEPAYSDYHEKTFEIVRKARDGFQDEKLKELADRWLNLIKTNQLDEFTDTASIFKDASPELYDKILHLIESLEKLKRNREAKKKDNSFASLNIDSWQTVIDDIIKKET